LDVQGQFQPGRQTRWWAKQTAVSLGKRLEELGSRLVLRRARDSIDTLKEVVLQTGAQAVFFNHLYDSISMVRDQQVKDTLRSMGVMVSTFNADLLYEPWEVLDEQQQVRALTIGIVPGLCGSKPYLTNIELSSR
jgi:cryptochrome 1